MKEDKDKGSELRPVNRAKGSPGLSGEKIENQEKASGSESSTYRMLLEFFSKEQFVEELRALNIRLREMQQWHDEWKEKQKSLDEERAKYRMLEGAISEVVLLLDASLRVLHCSSSIESLTGHKREEVVSSRLEKLLTPLSLKTFMERLAEELVSNADGREPSSRRTTELELHSREGGSVTGSARIGIRRGNDHEPAEIIVVISDVSDRKASEKTLSEVKDQYRMLFREMREPAYFVTADGEFFDVNPAWCNWMGYGRDEMIGMDIREVFSFPLKHPLYHHRAEGKEVRDLHAKLRQKSGAEEECAISATAWRATNGELLGYLGIVRGQGVDARDIKPERGKEDIRDILLAAVAHEIKKPVNVVLQGLEQVSRSVHDPIARETIERVSQAANRAGKVMNSVLDLYRGSPPTSERTDVVAVNNEIIFSYDEEVRARNISVITDFAPDLPPVGTNAGRLGQVISNILANSIAAIPRSGVITVRATKQTGEDGRNQVSLIYADTGFGMSENDLRKVFDPFYTTKGHSGGIGLGLTLSKEIIERSGGGIKIESRPGEGTTVSILLPCT